MARTVLIYAVALALVAAGLEWIQYRYLVHAFSVELYIGLIAAVFTAIGIWAGNRLTRGPAPPAFERNEAAIRALGLTGRECEILERLASGQSNRELAHGFGISANTVKTHLANLYAKLGVDRRIQAIEKARFLSLIPPSG